MIMITILLITVVIINLARFLSHLDCLPPSKEFLLKRSVAVSPLSTWLPAPPIGDAVIGRGGLEETSEGFRAAATVPVPLNVE